MDVKNLFPLDKYRAFLFDCDGTIADSMPVHLVAWNRALEKWGAQLTVEQHIAWAGRPTRRIVEMLNEEGGLSMPPEAISRDKEHAYLELIETVQPISAVAAAIESYHGRVPFAVVSGSPRESVTKTLKHLGIYDRFEVLVGAEDYRKGKPAPDCFLQAAEALKVVPAECLVFEDADLGVEAARSAGMGWVRVSAAGFNLAESKF